MMRIGGSPCTDLFQCAGDGQLLAPLASDLGAQHTAFYVNDFDATERAVLNAGGITFTRALPCSPGSRLAVQAARFTPGRPGSRPSNSSRTHRRSLTRR